MDQYGRKTLEEMRNSVRRRVDMYRAIVDPVTGSEGATLQQDPLASNETIDQLLNTGLFKRHVDITVADPTIMADEEKINLVANQVEYPLPADLLYLRALYYKDWSVTYSEVPPNPRVYLYEMDQENNISDKLCGVPTYRRRLNNIVLNDVPQQDNPGGLVVDYVKGPYPLLVDDQVLETPLAFILQEVIILDAAVYICSELMKLDATELRMSLKDLESRLSLAAVNYHTPKTIQLASPVIMAFAPGTRRRTWGSIVGWRF